jgi:hypothetical protein
MQILKRTSAENQKGFLDPLKSERERGSKYSRRVDESENSRKSERHFIVVTEKERRPSGKGRVKVKVLGWLEAMIERVAMEFRFLN